MLKIKLILSLIIIGTIGIALVGCKEGNFKQSCMHSKTIMEHATSLLVPTAVKDEFGKQKNVFIQNDNSKAIQYFRDKEKDIQRHYGIIKSNLYKSNKNYYDAMFAALYINEFYYFLIGESIDDRCSLVRLVKNNKDAQLSDWLVDDFFSPLKNNGKLKDNWLKIDRIKKKETILNILTTVKDQCE